MFLNQSGSNACDSVHRKKATDQFGWSPLRLLRLWSFPVPGLNMLELYWKLQPPPYHLCVNGIVGEDKTVHFHSQHVDTRFFLDWGQNPVSCSFRPLERTYKISTQTIKCLKRS